MSDLSRPAVAADASRMRMRCDGRNLSFCGYLATGASTRRAGRLSETTTRDHKRVNVGCSAAPERCGNSDGDTNLLQLVAAPDPSGAIARLSSEAQSADQQPTNHLRT